MSYQPVMEHGPLPESSFVAQARASIPPPRVTTAMASGRDRRRGVTEDIPEDVPQSSHQTSDNARGRKRQAKGGGRGNATGSGTGNASRGGRGNATGGVIFVEIYMSACMKLLSFVINFHFPNWHACRKWKDKRRRCKRRNWKRKWWKRNSI